jgi:hypothetical protein
MKKIYLAFVAVVSVSITTVFWENCLLAATTSKLFYYDPQRKECFEVKNRDSNSEDGFEENYSEIPEPEIHKNNLPEGRMTRTFPSKEKCEEKLESIQVTTPVFEF